VFHIWLYGRTEKPDKIEREFMEKRAKRKDISLKFQEIGNFLFDGMSIHRGLFDCKQTYGSDKGDHKKRN
jgi:hypothetical protein